MREKIGNLGVSPSRYLHKSHNVSVLLYHLVCSTKYRKKELSPKVERIILKTCQGIEERFEIEFVEIGLDGDHIHFLIQSIPDYSVSKIARVVKSLTAREVFEKAPGVKRALWGGEFWAKGYYVSTVGKHGNETVIGDYVKNQGKESESKYKQLYRNTQLTIFDSQNQ